MCVIIGIVAVDGKVWLEVRVSGWIKRLVEVEGGLSVTVSVDKRGKVEQPKKGVVWMERVEEL